MRRPVSSREIELMDIIRPYVLSNGTIREDAPQNVLDAFDELKKLDEYYN